MHTRSLLVLIAAIAVAVLTARLGFWQLDRAAQKLALQGQIDQRSALPPLPESELARDAALAEAQYQRAVTLQGRWVPERTVYLDNRQMGDGRPGFFVLTPLRLADGTAVVVQRGWLPRDPADRERVPPLRTPDGAVEVGGRIAPPPGRLFDFDGTASGAIRQNLDLHAFAQEIGVTLRPLSLLQTSNADDGLRRDWPRPAVDVQKHYGYAFQWFSLAALVTGLYVWFQLVKPRLRARR